MKILDNTILSNFAYVKQLELLAVVLPDAVTTPQVMDELRQGEATKRLPVSNWQWLTIASLTIPNAEPDTRGLAMRLSYRITRAKQINLS